jgi:hypothetical protein
MGRIGRLTELYRPLLRQRSGQFAFPPSERVASRLEAGAEIIKPLSGLVAYDCSLKNESPASVNDFTIYRDETSLARLCIATHSFHKRRSIHNRNGNPRI